MSYKPKQIFLKKGKAKPFWYHHPWVFSGAIKDIKGHPQSGDVVELYDDQRKFIGKGFFNDQSQIQVRLLSWNLHEKINRDFFKCKIQQAIALRHNLQLTSKANAYRLVHSEGDGLPGLTVDTYNRFLCVQFTSFGMDKRREMILDILQKELSPKCIVERYSAGTRRLEGLPEIDYLSHGTPPEFIEIEEYGLTFKVSLAKGQKTGFYLDQRENRLYASKFTYNKRVLDAFCYTGGFGVYSINKGKAQEVVFLDTSKWALHLAEQNTQLNKNSKSTFIKKDAFKYLSQIEEKFDVIVLDPPKVAPTKSNVKSALFALKNLNTDALNLLTSPGILITCDCSGDISVNDFLTTVNRAAIDANRTLRIIQILGAGPDHPVMSSSIDSSYLKVLFCQCW